MALDKDKKPIAFTRADGMRIRKAVQAYERGYQAPAPQRARWPVGGGRGPRKGILTTALTARSGSTPGTGSFSFRTWDGTAMSTETDEFTVRNDYLTAIVTGKVIWVMFEHGEWWLVVADC